MVQITDKILDKIRRETSLVKAVKEVTKLKKVGKSWKGCCPFHKEKSASFVVDENLGLYHCFGCGAGGDVIHFTRQILRLDFQDTVRGLYARLTI